MRKPLLVTNPVSDRRELRRDGGIRGKPPPLVSRTLIEPCELLRKGSYFA